MLLEFTVLLVDDDEDDRQIFQEAIHILKLPVKVLHAGDGYQALSLLRSHEAVRPNIMFFDLNMPRMNGLELLCATRGESAYDNIPIVMYSTSSRPEDINECLRCGADTYLPKHNSFTLFEHYLPNSQKGNRL